MTTEPPPAAAPERGADPPKAESDPKSATSETVSDESASGPTLRGSATDASDDQQAYESGRRTLRPGDLTFVSGGPDQKVHFGDRYYFHSSRQVAPNPGPVRSDELKEICDRYVAVPNYSAMYDFLANHRLLVLAGAPASGRSTTALHLLNELSPDAVSRLDPTTDVRTLDEASISRSCGYLGELNDSAGQLMQVHADRLAALLVRQESYCVLVASPTPAVQRAFAAYRVSTQVSPPPFDALLLAHIDAQLRSDDPPDASDRLTGLAHDDRFRDALGPDPRPSDVAELAGLLLAHVRGEIESQDEVIGRAAALLEHRIADWYAELAEPARRRQDTERALRLAALRIALAVFDDMPGHLALTCGAELGDLLIKVGTPMLESGRPLVSGGDDAVLLTLLHAESIVGKIRYGGVAVWADMLRYRDQRIPTALLTHVWKQHHNFRPPIIEWLKTLAVHPAPAVHVRAALASGLLCSVDFSYTFPLLVEPAALATPRRPRGDNDDARGDPEEADDPDERWEIRRKFAALSIDQVSRDERFAEVVDSTLLRWRRSPDPALRWTAALAWGYEMGLRDIERALDELRIIGTPQELEDVAELAPPVRTQTWGLVWAAGYSIARLFANGAFQSVLTYLLYWLEHPRQSLRQLALQAIVIIADIKMSIVTSRSPDRPSGEIAERELPRGWERWPVVLWMARAEPEITAQVAAAFRYALHDGKAGPLMGDILVAWMRLGQSDSLVLDALLTFFPFLVADDSDHYAVRFSISNARRQWADPLPADIADRLDAAITRTSTKEA